jgi:hypothetical protein
VNNTIKRLLAFVAVLVACPALGSAQELTEDTGRGPSHTFGRSGQLAIMGETAFEISHATESDTTRLTLSPGADFFVMDNLSVGAFIALQYLSVGDSSTTRFDIGPRVGYNITLSDLISIWPKIGLSFTSFDSDDSDNTGIALNLFAPLMIHPATHFFLGVGPFLDVGLSGDDKDTIIGLRLTVGGWLEL